jgi:transcriptional regulator with XRE-family HTH domain
MRLVTYGPDDVRGLRSALCLSQEELAKRLGVTRRTVIRAEQRGIEIPWRPDSPRAAVYAAWAQLQEEAARSPLRFDRLKKSRDTLDAIAPRAGARRRRGARS